MTTRHQNGLIVTADDFGLSIEVNEAIEIAHRRGILTAASLMVAGPAAADAIGRARKLPGLNVGLHLALVEATPMLPAAQLPDLTDASGRFRENMALSGARIYFSPSARRQLTAEVDAQFAAFATTGLKLDHVNAHKHFHMHPTILRVLLQTGLRYGARAIRLPFEQRTMINGIEPGAAGLSHRLFTFGALIYRDRIRRAGFGMPDRVAGLAWSGGMDTRRMAALIAGLPDGVTELYTHPAISDNFPGSAVGYRYRDEFEALISSQARAAVESKAVTLGGYADFCGG